MPLQPSAAFAGVTPAGHAPYPWWSVWLAIHAQIKHETMGKLVKYDGAEQVLVDEAEISALLARLGKSLYVDDVLLRSTSKQPSPPCIIMYHLFEQLRRDGHMISCWQRVWSRVLYTSLSRTTVVRVFGFS